MKKYFVIYLSIFLMAYPNILSANAPMEESLLFNWENIQKNDPKIINFKKIREGVYEFSTKLFPFEGELRVLNSFIDELPINILNNKYYSAAIEIELVGLSDDIIKKYSKGYWKWQQNNQLYYDVENSKWLNNIDYTAEITDNYNGWAWGLLDNLGAILFIVLVIFLWFLSKKADKQTNKAMISQNNGIKVMEDGLLVQKESNELLKEYIKTQKTTNELLEQVIKRIKEEK